MDYLSTFILLSLGRYLFRWTIYLRLYYYHWVDTSSGGLFIYVYITITGSIPLQVDYLSTFILLSLGRYLFRWTIYLRLYYYHWVDTSSGGQFIYVYITITGSIPLRVDYLSTFILLSLGRYLFGWTIYLRLYYYHWVDTSSGGLFIYVYITITGSIPLQVDYLSTFILLSLGRYLFGWTIYLRLYYYHWVDTSSGGLFIYVYITITGSIPLRVDYLSTFILLSLGRYLFGWTIYLRLYYYHWVDTSSGGLFIYVYITITGSIPLRVDYLSTFILLSLGRYLFGWTIYLRLYYYHWVDTSSGGLFIYVYITITGSIPLQVDYLSTFILLSLGRYLFGWTIYLRLYYYHWVDTSSGGLFIYVYITITGSIPLRVDYLSTFILLSLGRYLFGWTIYLRLYYYHWVDTSSGGLFIYVYITITGSIPLRVDYLSTFILLSLGRYLFGWTIYLRLYYYHWVDTSSGGLFIYVYITITGLIPLQVDYLSTFILLSLGRYLFGWTIYLRLYYYHWVDTSSGGLFIYVYITITGSIPLRVDYLSTFILLSLGRYLFRWTIYLRLYYYHWVDTSSGGLFIYVYITITGSIPLRVDYLSTFILLSLGRYLFGWTIYLRLYYYHWVDTSSGGQFIYVYITITGSIPLRVDYLSTFILLSLGRYLFGWTIYLRLYYYHWVDTSSGGLFIYVYITITGSIPLRVDYLSTFILLSLGRYLFGWTIYLRLYYYHWVDTSSGGLLVPEGITRPVVSASALTWFIRYIYY